MEFSKAQFEELITEITKGMTDFSGKLDMVLPVASAAVDHWYVIHEVRRAVLWLARETVDVGKAILDFLADLLKGALAPVYMFFDAHAWSDIGGSATGVSSALSGQNLVIDHSDWSGRGHDAYVAAAAGQSAAATQIGSIAGNVRTHLLSCAVAGTAFYTLLAAVLVKLVVAAASALVAFGSVVFSWAGAAIVLEEAALNTFLVQGSMTALTAFLAAQATALVVLHGEAVDGTTFPEGRWPRSDTAAFDDATVTDGDADWSLRG